MINLNSYISSLIKDVLLVLVPFIFFLVCMNCKSLFNRKKKKKKEDPQHEINKHQRISEELLKHLEKTLTL